MKTLKIKFLDAFGVAHNDAILLCSTAVRM